MVIILYPISKIHPDSFVKVLPEDKQDSVEPSTLGPPLYLPPWGG